MMATKSIMARTARGNPAHNELKREMDGIFDDDQEEFLAAVAEYKEVNHKQWLRISEYLWIAKRLGYKKA